MSTSIIERNYKVGDRHPRFQAFRGHPEGAIFEIIGGSANITILLDNPTPNEIHHFVSGEVKTGLYTHKSSLLFFLLKIGIAKFSCPYDHSALPEKFDAPLKIDAADKKLDLYVELLNRKDQSVYVKRHVKLSPRQTSMIKEIIAKQRMKDFNRENHIQNINEVYTQFPNEDTLIANSSGLNPAVAIDE